MVYLRFYLTLEECKSWLTGVKGDTGASFYLTLEECKFSSNDFAEWQDESFYLTLEECKFVYLACGA